MNSKSITKTLHIICACLWFGAAMSVVLLQCTKGWVEDHQRLLALNQNFSLVDIVLIIPGALGSMITGFLICRNTNWGFTRYWWVIAKGIATLCGILIGTALLGPWQMRLVELSDIAVLVGARSPSYNLIRLLFTLVSFLQIFLLIFIITLSVRKPWGKRIATANVLTKMEQSGEVIAQVWRDMNR